MGDKRITVGNARSDSARRCDNSTSRERCAVIVGTQEKLWDVKKLRIDLLSHCSRNEDLIQQTVYRYIRSHAMEQMKKRTVFAGTT
ncbi:hypothetical protein KIN20_009872 [Parelaphostrongylus tenuis]|uniref:Uncharacterized protein n=1 Tax=Parelaphostrongylus tenuis TaxID=148309 RepID=A0AAD5MR51_PARTN|nr:hypothetical protein KIN20_009872 [Parelaphostrongylus tenuis]